VVSTAVADGDTRLADVARRKLSTVQEAKAEYSSQVVACLEVTRLERLTGRLACLTSWCSAFAYEQALVFATSFGALLCLALDSSDTLKWLRISSSSNGAGKEGHRQQFFLATFLRLAIMPTVPLPRHWRFWGRFTALTLRCLLLLPVGSFCLVTSFGSLCSIARFAERCLEARAHEHEKMARTQWFNGAFQICSSIMGFSCMGLFAHLYFDARLKKGLPIT